MAQMGRTTANPTQAIYARQMNRRDGEPAQLTTLVNGSTTTPESLESVGVAAMGATSR